MKELPQADIDASIQEAAVFLEQGLAGGGIFAAFGFKKPEGAIFEKLMDDMRPDVVTNAYGDKSNAEASVKIALARAANEDVEKVAKELAIGYIESGKPLPPILATFVVNVLRYGSGKLVPRAALNEIRDSLIFEAVNRIVKRGFLRYRNSSKRNNRDALPSAFSIVAQAAGLVGLNMGEEAVATVWRNVRKRPFGKESKGSVVQKMAG